MLAVIQNRLGRQGFCLGVASMMALIASATAGYWLGNVDATRRAMPDLSLISSAASGANMAVATGQISDEAEGVFFLDYLTGDLQCLVYYPRQGAFGARYYTNVQAQLPGSGKNAQYLMVTGNAIASRSSSNLRPANCLVYVTDVSSGLFAAYVVPWNKTAESSSQIQGGPLVYVGGGPIRNFSVPDIGKKPNAPAAKPPANAPPNPGGAKDPAKTIP